MSEDPAHGASTIKASKREGGGAGKWLLGGLAAVVLAGGGYAAWQTFGSGQDNAQSAYNDTYSDTYAEDSQRDDLTADTASTSDADADAGPAATAPRSTARRSTASTEEVPEETIGVTPASYSTESDSDEIVVEGSRRPVWVRTPSERRLTSLYPARALERGREGEARLHCTVEERGTLDCVRVEETPGGFGTAAMRVANTLRHAPTRRDGTDATGTPVNLRVVFRIDENERRRG